MPNPPTTEAGATPFYGWKLLVVLFVIYFFNVSFPYYGGVVVNSIMSEDLGISRSTLGLGVSVFSMALGFAAPLAGYMVTKRGVRYTLLVGSGLLISGTLLMALVVTQPWHYVLIFGVLVGVGVAMGSIIPIQSCVTAWFSRRRSMAIAVVMSAAGFGSLAAAPLLVEAIDLAGGDWRIGWLIISATIVISVIGIAFGVVNDPNDLGQWPDGLPECSNADNSQTNMRSRVYQTLENWSARRAIGTPALWLIVAGAVAFGVPFYISIAHGVVHLIDLGHDREFASLSIGVVVMSSVGGRLLGGWAGDRVEARYIWLGALILMALATFFLMHAETLVLAYSYAALMGISMGASYVCMITLMGNYFGVQAYPSIAGIVFPISTLVGALAPVMAGRLYDAQGSYDQAFVIAMVLSLLGAALIFFARPPQ